MRKYSVVLFMVLMTALVLVSCKRREQVKNESSEVVSTLSQQDAASIVEEKLDDGDYSFNAEGKKSVGDTDYYIFAVSYKDKPLEQSLAVEVVSGKVFTYLEALGEISDYSDFSGYKAENDESIEWNGEYASDKYTVMIEEQDPASFSFTVSPKDADKDVETGVTGFASKQDNVRASAELEGILVNLDLDGDELYIGGADEESAYAGKYTKVK